MGLITNRLNRESLIPGDHIYTWRARHIYAHHGIYVGDNTVIHFTVQGKESGGGTRLGRSVSSCSHLPPPTGCGIPVGARHDVIRSCLYCFLAGGKLSHYKYSVSKAFFLAKVRGGTCTLAPSDEDEIVIDRANYLLHNGFGRYNLLVNNCENFALYCKTGLMLVEPNRSTSGQVLAVPEAILACSVGALALISHHVIPGSVIVPYSVMRLRKDIGVRKDVDKVSVEELAST